MVDGLCLLYRSGPGGSGDVYGRYSDAGNQAKTF